MSDFPATENGKISLKGRVAIVTGAGNGLGRAYALSLAKRGAKVVINDLGPSTQDKNRKAAEVVVEEITKAGGEAIANLDSNLEGAKIVKQAVDKWGRVDILINNAGILRDKSFKSMSDKEWDAITAVHITGSYACARAAWPHFREQKFGRIINISSAAGIYGNFGQANYSAAKMAMISFTKTLAIEGARYNIFANTIAPIAASQMLASIMPPEILENLKPEFVAPLATFLCSAANEDISGQLIESGAGFMASLRRQRSRGVVFKTDQSFTPSAVKAKVDEILDFDNSPEYPDKITDANHLEFLERAKEAKPNEGKDEVRFDGKTVLITGAGAGLGKAYAEMFGKLGANVVVNDFSADNANKTVEELKKAGYKAAPAIGSVEDGEKIVKAAVDAFGGLHVVINNAGILRDKSFAGVEDKDWHAVVNIHLRGTYAICKAAWPIFIEQKYGRIVNTTSAVGIYGNFGQANYSTAKGGILGFTQTLAIEGQKYNILANTIAPNAGTAMTSTIWPQEMVDAFKTEYIAPAVGYLASEANEEHTKLLWEVSGGWVAAVRWQRAGGHAFSFTRELQVESIQKRWGDISNYESEESSFPASNQEAMEQIMSNIGNAGESEEGDEEDGEGDEDFSHPDDPKEIAEAKKAKPEPSEFSYTERDVILYALGVGAGAKELPYVYEGDDDFAPVPTFGVILSFGASSGLDMGWLQNFDPTRLLHAEQYLALHKKLPTEALVRNEPRFIEVLDKGKAAVVTSRTLTKAASDGTLLATSESTVFCRGAGGFGGQKQGKDRGAASAANQPPKRSPDNSTKFKTGADQAALYRLSGDLNPLHIAPDFAKMGGFDQPILHGLCSFGIAGKILKDVYGPWKAIKVRFTGVLYPGETLQIDSWKEGERVIFTATAVERKSPVLGAAAVELGELSD
ncbi:multifunctional beta-oxidation protein [Ceraceosorus bombacis]|uniref:Multifunctional beta-oxidation protein n=1 Tax=Ceraceosorus bombacis TaxID=401625 RepID=A0A0P1BM32_9BASI|nr:multifunctional beta-oxidation protein [Ceraceosorus bombacis]